MTLAHTLKARNPSSGRGTASRASPDDDRLHSPDTRQTQIEIARSHCRCGIEEGMQLWNKSTPEPVVPNTEAPVPSTESSATAAEPTIPKHGIEPSRTGARAPPRSDRRSLPESWEAVIATVCVVPPVVHLIVGPFGPFLGGFIAANRVNPGTRGRIIIAALVGSGLAGVAGSPGDSVAVLRRAKRIARLVPVVRNARRDPGWDLGLRSSNLDGRNQRRLLPGREKARRALGAPGAVRGPARSLLARPLRACGPLRARPP